MHFNIRAVQNFGKGTLKYPPRKFQVLKFLFDERNADKCKFC